MWEESVSVYVYCMNAQCVPLRPGSHICCTDAQCVPPGARFTRPPLDTGAAQFSCIIHAGITMLNKYAIIL